MLVVISSTNNTLEEVYIKNGVESTYYGAYEDSGSRYGNLFAQGDTNVQTLVNGLSKTKVIPVADASRVTDQDIDGATGAQNNGYAFTDVQVINGSAFQGNLKLNAILTENVVGKYGDLGDFAYTLGGGGDVFDLALSSVNLETVGTVSRGDFILKIDGGSGNDRISTAIYTGTPNKVDYEGTTPQIDDDLDLAGALPDGSTAWYANAGLHADLSIVAGAGDDVVNTFGSGDWEVYLGTGDDTYYADNAAKDGAATGKAVWVFNTADQDTTNAADRDLANLVGGGNDTYIAPGASYNSGTSQAGLYGLKLRVVYKDVSASDNVIDPGNTSGAGVFFSEVIEVQGVGDKFHITDRSINQAIRDAINDPDGVLSKLLVASEGTAGDTLVVKALSDGQHVNTDLQIEFAVPNTTLTATEVSDWLKALNLKSDWSSDNATNLATARTNALKELVGGTPAASDLDDFGPQIKDHTGWYTSDAANDYASAFANYGAANTNYAGANSEHTSSNLVIVEDKDDDGHDVIVLSTGSGSEDVIQWKGEYNHGTVTVVNFDAADVGTATPAVYELVFSGWTDTTVATGGKTITVTVPGGIKVSIPTTSGATAKAAVGEALELAFNNIKEMTGLTADYTSNKLTLTGENGVYYPEVGDIAIHTDDTGLDVVAAVKGVTVTPFVQAKVEGLGDDKLDFSAYNAKWIGAAVPGSDKYVAEWSTDAADDVEMSDLTLEAGEKYITLTRADEATTLYDIKLWTVVAGNEGDTSASTRVDAFTAVENDTSILIGQIDLGRVIEGYGTTGTHEILAQVDLV
jgi:hypothetical protein